MIEACDPEVEAVFRMLDGRVLRCEEFGDLAAARKAAGIPAAE
jgi:hypothetical protein